MNIKLLTEQHLEFLSLKGGYTGSSESTHVQMPHCWKSHVIAQFCWFAIMHFSVLFSRYIPPLKPATSKWSLELPDNPVAIQEELSKQESLLNQLHEELAGKADPEKEEQIWEVQRVCTQLKRKVHV